MENQKTARQIADEARLIAFVEHFLRHGVGSYAVLDAGWNQTPGAASVTAGRLLRRADVREMIARRQEELSAALRAETLSLFLAAHLPPGSSTKKTDRRKRQRRAHGRRSSSKSPTPEASA